MRPVKRPEWWPLVVTVSALMISGLGILADTTSIITNQSVKKALSAVYPYMIVLATLTFALLAVVYWWRARRLAGELVAAAARIDDAYALEIALFRRLCRVIGSNLQIETVPSVPESRIQPLFDELLGALPSYFESHHKFSVARPNEDGSFTLLAARGMDPAAISSIERRASWLTGRSFYAALLNAPGRAEWRIYSTEDTSYVDTRAAGDSAARPTSSSSHFILALRDEDLYARLPKHTLALVSVGIPKRVGVPTDAQGEELFRSVLPVAKAVEALLLAEVKGSQTKTEGKRTFADETKGLTHGE